MFTIFFAIDFVLFDAGLLVVFVFDVTRTPDLSRSLIIFWELWQCKFRITNCERVDRGYSCSYKHGYDREGIGKTARQRSRIYPV